MIFFLDIKEPSVEILPMTTVKEKSAVVIICKSNSSSPVNYTWYKDGNVLPIREREIKIPFVNLSDSGNYSCIIANDFGGTKSPLANMAVYCKSTKE